MGIILDAYLREMQRMEEGIDYDEFEKTVSYNPSHEEGADTSLENNPSFTDEFGDGVRVYSIFKRKHDNYRDANPLIYALKGENDWHFKTNKDRYAVFSQAEKIIRKFSNVYKVGVTIMCPSGGTVNKAFANLLLNVNKNATLITDLLRKLTAEEVIDSCSERDSYFRRVYNERNKFNIAMATLRNAARKMKAERDGYFTFHFIYDDTLRDAITHTVELDENVKAKYVAQINDKDILIIDDTISHGNTIRNVINEIKLFYTPKSITVLTLLSGFGLRGFHHAPLPKTRP